MLAFLGLLQDPKWFQWSGCEIARQGGASSNLAALANHIEQKGAEAAASITGHK